MSDGTDDIPFAGHCNALRVLGSAVVLTMAKDRDGKVLVEEGSDGGSGGNEGGNK